MLYVQNMFDVLSWPKLGNKPGSPGTLEQPCLCAWKAHKTMVGDTFLICLATLKPETRGHWSGHPETRNQMVCRRTHTPFDLTCPCWKNKKRTTQHLEIIESNKSTHRTIEQIKNGNNRSEKSKFNNSEYRQNEQI